MLGKVRIKTRILRKYESGVMNYFNQYKCKCFLIIIICILCTSVLAHSVPDNRKMILIVADHLRVDDLNYFKEYCSRSSSMGLMVTRTDCNSTRAENSELETAAYLTLGTGLPSAGSDQGIYAFNVNESFSERNAEEIFKIRNTFDAGGSKIVHIGVNYLKSINYSTEWKSRVGVLGDILRKNDIRCSVFGNSDTLDSINRAVTLIAIDSYGLVPDGDVSDGNYIKDNSYPSGVKTNTGFLIKKISHSLNNDDFIVIDYGDTTRLDKYRKYSDRKSYENAHDKIMRELVSFVSKVIDICDINRTQIIVLSPTAYNGAISDRKTLTPVIVTGNGAVDGLITSGSTKRRGIVKNTDIASHVCAYFGVDGANDFIGSKFEFEESVDQLDYLKKFHDMDVFVESRIGFLKIVIVWHLIVLLLCFVISLKVEIAPRGWTRLMTFVVGYTATMFLSMLLIASLHFVENSFQYTVVLLSISIVIALIM